MIRLLTEADRQAALDLFAQAPHFNLYLWGNVVVLGFAHDFCEFWGDVDETATPTRLRAVLNRYMTGWTAYGEADADWADLGRIVDTHPAGATRLQDNPGGIASFLPYLTCYQGQKVSSEELMVLEPAAFRPLAAPAGVTVRRGVMTDLPALVKLYADAGDMTRTSAAVARPLQDTRLWLAEQQGEISAVALTNAEIPQMAMIGGVFTLPAARGRGLSQAVCSALCAELIREGKQPALYWINPAAGAVYHKLGFQPIGHWRSVRLERV